MLTGKNTYALCLLCLLLAEATTLPSEFVEKVVARREHNLSHAPNNDQSLPPGGPDLELLGAVGPGSIIAKRTYIVPTPAALEPKVLSESRFQYLVR